MKTILIRVLGTTCLVAIFMGLGNAALNERTQSDAEPQNAVNNEVQSEQSAASASAMPRKRSDIYYTAITDRPLFAQSRRPMVPDDAEPVAVVPVEVPPEPEDTALPSVALLGLMGGTDMRQALVAVEGNVPEWLSIGDKLGPWTLSDAGSDWLEISSDTQKIRLELYQ